MISILGREKRWSATNGIGYTTKRKEKDVRVSESILEDISL